VNGAVIASFSVETLLYDETMLDWRVHEGLDLAASEGTRVLATAAGTVSAVYEDELMGTTIVIDHGEGLESVYSNLGAMPNVAAGDSVYTGDIIAAVGSTAAAESGRDAHLHFALYLDGQAVDPEEYLPE
jgi:murein DD-endopeptidase MepM/ murein hydrolase activator NlpD